MRRKIKNPPGYSALGCALAGAGLYLLYRKFKGLSDPPDDGYALSIPTPPVPSEAPRLQAKVMADRQPNRRIRPEVERMYASIQEKSIPSMYAQSYDQMHKIAKPTVTRKDYKIYEPGQFDVTGAPPKATPTTTVPLPAPRGTTSENEKKKAEEEVAEEVDLQKRLIKGDMDSALRWVRELAPGVQEWNNKAEEARRRAAALPEGTTEKWSAENDALSAELNAVNLAWNIHTNVAEKYSDTDGLIERTADMAKSSGLGDARAKEIELELRQWRDAWGNKYWLVPNPNPKALLEVAQRLDLQLQMRRGY